ncbi:type II toxin-antitoxin system RelE/ParE family toxin [Paralimibaculum aggregatum]|uniref:Type II toxin-antitoxin system RelE/ParE family toxin n=1 Tax=Paralimibaculum aggregatum TaxID=3036245 RepID=A0ABQ6LU47_9RHOB|nr:type II toxin-antitoxin system RelE/ParE family toxin [Limibaculum sp. NKW23]GMG85616.1 type II toxin-antitoxin system RelE/ParE family toxin [Limibaculum sp. NKW23]
MIFRLTARAEEDIIQTYLEGAREFGGAQAEAYHARLERTLALLADNPRLARGRTELAPPVRVHPCGVHVIVHLVDESDDVLIVRLRHGREDWVVDPI